VTEVVNTTMNDLPFLDFPSVLGSRGVLITDAGGRIIFSDSNIRGILGLPEGRLVGLDFADAVAQALCGRVKGRELTREDLSTVVNQRGQALEDVYELVGEGRVLHRYSAPLFAEDGDYAGRVEVFSDITRRKQLEAAVRHAYDELKATQEQLVQSEKLRAVGEIASGVAHDFNNILGIILGNIQMVMRGASDQKTLKRLMAAERAALDGAETVRRIQEFTRMRLQDQPTVIDLSAISSEVAEMLTPAWESSAQVFGGRVRLEMDLEGRVLVLGIAPEIREVLANIMLNAIQAMPRGGVLTVSTGQSESVGWVKIVDTGIGMDDEVKRKVFEPFFTTRGPEGTGLGMSVAYGIVRRHGGRITIESEPQSGTVVTVFLPLAEASHSVADSKDPVIHPTRPARILIVDDEEMFAKVFAEMLTECGHVVITARSGPQALEQFRQESFDVVFTDLAMPDMSGWDVAREIKGLSPQTPVVLMTGWGTRPDGHEPSDCGVDIVLPKPVRMDELSAVLSMALGHGKEARG